MFEPIRAWLEARAGVRRGASLGVVEMVDVAPTVAALLDLDLEVAEGEPIREAVADRGP